MAHQDCSGQEGAVTDPPERPVRAYREYHLWPLDLQLCDRTTIADRQVGIPYITRWILPDKPLPLMMLKEGQAVVYEAGGAEYGQWGVDKMKQIEDEARSVTRMRELVTDAQTCQTRTLGSEED